MIDWELWHSARELSVTGSYLAAGKQMGVNATTIKRRKEALERLLGRRLFTKAHGKMTPTPAFVLALKKVDTAAIQLERARTDISSDLEHLTWRNFLITSVSYICDNLLSPAVFRLPDIRRLRIELVGQDKNYELTGSGGADIALRLGPTHSKGISAWHIADITCSTYVSRRVRHKNVPWITIDRSHSHLKEGRLPEEYSGEEGIRFTATTATSMKNVIDSGAAKGILPDFVGTQNPELTILENHPTVTRPLWLMWHDSNLETPHFKTVLNWILLETVKSLQSTKAASKLLKRFSS